MVRSFSRHKNHNSSGIFRNEKRTGFWPTHLLSCQVFTITAHRYHGPLRKKALSQQTQSFFRNLWGISEDVGARMLQCPEQLAPCWTVRQIAAGGCRRSLSSRLLFKSFVSKGSGNISTTDSNLLTRSRWGLVLAGRGAIEPEVQVFPKSLSPKGRLGLRIVRQAAGTQRLRSGFGYFGFFVAAEIFSHKIGHGETA
jgi:hypothetical protein